MIENLPTAEQWRELFAEVPGSMGALLSELFVVIDEAQLPRNPLLSKPQIRHTAQDLHDALYPQFSNEPFAVAIQPLLRPSLRAVAEYSGIDKAHLARMIQGKLALDANKLERIAKAVGVDPGYFLEYRQMFVADMVARQVQSNPTVGIAAYKALANVKKGRSVVVTTTHSGTGV